MSDTPPNDPAASPQDHTPKPAQPKRAEFNPANVAKLDSLARENFRVKSRQQQAMDAISEILGKAWLNGVPASQIAATLSAFDYKAKGGNCDVDATTVSRYCKRRFGSRNARKDGGASTATDPVPPPSPENPSAQEGA